MSTWASSKSDVAKTGITDGSSTDLQAALDYIRGRAEDGWVITHGDPGGNYTHSAVVDFNGAGTWTNSVTIKSAGGVANKTTLTANFSTSGSALAARVRNGKLINIYGFIFKVSAGNYLSTGWVNFDTNTTGNVFLGFRCHHNRFEDAGGNTASNRGPMLGISFPDRSNSGAIYGLIDQNVFYTTDSSVTTCDGVYVYCGNTGASSTDLGNWNGSMTWGTTDTVCIENNVFTVAAGNTVEGNPAIDSAWFGGRLLVRYNTFTNWVTVGHGADSAKSSVLQSEYYHNTYNLTTNDAVDYIHYHRGGCLRFYDNTINCTGGASLNQIIKTAMDRDASRAFKFQTISHGTTAGVESVHGDYVWSNHYNGTSATEVGQPNNPNNQGDTTTGQYVLNTNYFLSAPAGHSEIVYPHPLNDDTPTTFRLGFRIHTV